MDKAIYNNPISRLFFYMLYKLKRWKVFNNLNIFQRLVISFGAVIVVPLTIVGIVSYTQTSKIVEEEVSKSTFQTIKQTGYNIEYFLDSVKQALDSVYVNSEVQKIIQQNSVEFTQAMANYQTLSNILSNNKYYDTAISTSMYLTGYEDYRIFYDGSNVYTDKLVKDTAWYKETMENTTGVYWMTTHIPKEENFGTPVVSAVRILRRFDNNKYAGIVVLNIKEEHIRNILNNVTLGDTGSLFLIDNKGVVVSHKDKSKLMKNLKEEDYIKKVLASREGSFTQEIDGKDTLVVHETVPGIGWKIIGVVPTRELTSKVSVISRVLLVVGACGLILALLLSVVIAYNISIPIRKLMLQMKKAEQGDFDFTAQYQYNNEVGALYNSFENMISKINFLIEEGYKKDIDKKEAQLKALQAQINPHFLYNTLESVKWMAIKYGAKDISTMVTNLASLLRISLNRGQDLLPIRDEIDQVKSYIAIQQVRYKNKFSVVYDIDEKVYEYQTIKLLLQPLVENAIVHGFEETEEAGVIRIRGRVRGNYIFFQVSDNGKGADLESINNVLEGKEPKSTKGYGIKNVNDRIKLFMGNQFGIKYYKNHPSGIKVKVRLYNIEKLPGNHG